MRDLTQFEVEVYVAINEQFGHVSRRFPLDKFARIIGHCASDIEPILKDKNFTSILNQVGMLLWFEEDAVCIVDSIRMKLRQPCGPYVCRHCLIDSHGVMEKDPDPRSRNGWIHPQCMPRYSRLLHMQQMIEERANAYGH